MPRKFKRETCKSALAELVARAETLNARDDLPYVIECIVVFGSYCRPPFVERLGDLDIGFSWRPRSTDQATQKSLHAEAITRAPRRFHWLDVHWWPQVELRRLLRGGRRLISLHEMDVDYRVVLTDWHHVAFGQIPSRYYDLLDEHAEMCGDGATPLPTFLTE